jgi:hypothetical protein
MTIDKKEDFLEGLLAVKDVVIEEEKVEEKDFAPHSE